MFEDNKDFYPTPQNLIARMWHKIPKKARNDANYILEPQAGGGAIVDYLKNVFQNRRSPTIHAIEKDERLAAILRDKNISVIDSDFLAFNGPDKYDIIIGNPPFNGGHYHLLKAIDIMYSGHISFLLNAETIRNPHTNSRKRLVKRLSELNADIEYLISEFEQAERKTSVEVALILIYIERKIEADLFDGVIDAEEIDPGAGHEQREVAEKESIRGMVADYNRKVDIGTQVLMDFYKNYFHVAPYVKLVVGDDEKSNILSSEDELTSIMKDKLNQLVRSIRKSYWEKALELDAVRKRMTKEKRDQFHHQLQQNSLMDFTEHNIRAFVLNLLKSYEDILTDAVVKSFDVMTKHAYDEGLNNENVHYFTGWKTNKAFYVNKKVILPYYNFWDSDWKEWRTWKPYSSTDTLTDFDIVMNYFDGRASYTTIMEALEHAFGRGESRKILSTYFETTVYKKGTIHLTFRDDDVLRRFNVTACRGKGWLPYDYGQEFYETLDPDHQAVVDSFEGREAYDLNVQTGPSLFRSKPALQIDYENVIPMVPKEMAQQQQQKPKFNDDGRQMGLF
ncbi:hypothetical protein DSCO28_73100 (plasmid) [Desulfosarcina ovata subsp. sediminis]|uniref:DUF4942 domain-containing protein n=1 Tax=Desulfosarcina ovata subsp. sediminis TaxID=885957 RepID=A0A5K8A312_9BACT|nr:DUF4942 domain-containing protein [Desulfosarcina ovata]BBO86744.1 hypothetical protein DSCO28_73100 [Desulfosarcina ovata subsp. sediminis]